MGLTVRRISMAEINLTVRRNWEVTPIPDIREQSDRRKDKHGKRPAVSTAQRQMVQKFVKEVNDSAKQPDHAVSAESAAAEQVEVAACEIVHEAVQLPRTTSLRNSSPDRSRTEQSAPRQAPDLPRQRTADALFRSKPKLPQNVPAPTPQEQGRRAYAQQAAGAAVTEPTPEQLQEHPAALDVPRQCSEDLCTQPEPVQTQNTPKLTPRRQARCAYIQQTAKTKTEPTQNEAGETETVLTITITAKTAEQMRLEYAFSMYQDNALDVLHENLGSLHIPMGSLTISQEDAIVLLENLPDDLDPARKAVVETALQLVGKVSYFWGGKSLVLGWDDRWGVPTEVAAEGSGSTGTVRPFGLDCSGFVDWVFYNATNGVYYPGHGGGAATQHSDCENIPWSEAQPGDLVLYPDDSHVGIVGGTDADGNLLIIHCSGGANGVVITGAAGFTAVARPGPLAGL